MKNFQKNNIKQLSLLIFCIGSSFTFGNIFGIYTRSCSNSYVLILYTLCFIECISFFKYSKRVQLVEKNFLRSTLVSTCFNAAKRGFLIGLFIEAFKVGS